MNKKRYLILLIVLVSVSGLYYVFSELNKPGKTAYELVDFQQLNTIKEDNSILVLFIKQDGCPACSKVEPILNEFAKNSGIKVASIIGNREENKGIYEYYNITSTPTIIFFLNGQEKNRLVGIVDKETLTKGVDELIL